MRTPEEPGGGGLPLWDLVAALLSTAAFAAVMVGLRDHMEWSTPLILAAPVVATWLPLLLSRRAHLAVRVAALIALLAVILLGVFSVGLLFVPSAVAVVVAIVRYG